MQSRVACVVCFSGVGKQRETQQQCFARAKMFLYLLHFRAVILLPNPTEALATKAKSRGKHFSRLPPLKLEVRGNRKLAGKSSEYHEIGFVIEIKGVNNEGMKEISRD